MKINLKKLSNKKTAIIVGVVLFSLLLPNITQAKGVFEFLFGDTFSAANIAQSFLVFVSDGIFWLLHWAVRAGAAVFDAMLKIGFQSHLDVVKGGWEVSRNIANMFFILFLVIIAFATILRIEKYGIKQLLPKVIIIALLINFSLVICSVIIDFSNIAAKFFINEITSFADTESGVSANFIDSLKILSVYTPIEANCDNLSDDVPFGPPPPGQTMPTKSPRQECEDAQTQTSGSGDGVSIVNFFIQTTVGSLVLIIAAFVLFAGAFMLLIRIVVLWFLLMLVPLVFICYIMPSLRKMWQDWWRTFLRWCLFAPAYAFFVWLAMKISVETRNKPIVEIPSSGFVDQGGLGNIFTADPGTSLIHYFFIIALLLGGLIAAQKFGIYGSGAAMNIVQKAGRGARSWAGRTTMRPVKRAGRTALTVGAALPLLKKTRYGRRMQAKADQMKQRLTDLPKYKRLETLHKTMANPDILKTVEQGGLEGFMATKEALRRGILKGAKRETKIKAMKNLRSYGETDAAMKLEEISPETIDATTKTGKQNLDETLRKAHENGADKNFAASTFEGPEGITIIETMRTILTPSEFNEVFKKWAKDTQKSALAALQSQFDDNLISRPDARGKETNENILRRKTVAKNTGEVDTAFLKDSENKPIKLKPGEKEIDTNIKDEEGNTIKISKDVDLTIENHIKSLDGEGFKNLKNKESRMLAARHMTTGQVENAGAKLTGDKQEELKNEIKRLITDPETDATIRESRKKVLELMEKSLTWGGSGNTVNLGGKQPGEEKPKEGKEPPFSTV